MDGLHVYRRQEDDKMWQPEETQPIHGDHMGERGEMVRKSFVKTGIFNSMNGTEDDNLWQDSGESSSSEEAEETWDTDERLTQQEW